MMKHEPDEPLLALADPTRRAILRLVWDEELPAGDIAAHFPVTRPAISRHLRVLRDANLVEEHRVGTKRLYRARPERIEELRSYLENYWEAGLGEIKRLAEREAMRKRNEDG
ncbi:metalloregulator ArsR/SmtB family transcription factor [bacterium]|nr:metalloregulator ArsR/SmtB family transcription factor [bacterium]